MQVANVENCGTALDRLAQMPFFHCLIGVRVVVMRVRPQQRTKTPTACNIDSDN
jgi:hypothetical protein